MPSSLWFHPYLTGKDAEEMLALSGMEGSFLVRNSMHDPGHYVLAVRQGGKVQNMSIRCTEEYLDMHGGEKFATLSELIDFYRRHPGALRNKEEGVTIELKSPVLAEAAATALWYHAGVSGKEAERLMQTRGVNGSFLVRESMSKPGTFVLTSRISKSDIAHYPIANKEGRYLLPPSAQAFDTLEGLVEHLQEIPRKDVNDNVIKLTDPLESEHVSAASIRTRIEELSKAKEHGLHEGLDGFEKEFDELREVDAEVKEAYSRQEGTREENYTTKNRYRNILPYDHSRVILEGDPAVPGSDYINANYIDGEAPGTKQAYIASQGPLPGTVASFWQMVWENDVRLIIMATGLVENRRTKCHMYWPQKEETVHGRNTLKLVRESEGPHVTIREISVTNASGEVRTVHHYHFLDWPDHGVPEEPSTVLQLLADVNAKKADLEREAKGPVGPIVIHCSAGIGRTGVLLVVDIALRAIQENGIDVEINLKETVERLRRQRSGMIQKAEQYRFCFEAIASHMATLSERGKAIARRMLSKGDVIYENIDELKQDGAAAAAPPIQPRLSPQPKARP
eukprot:CAMPEP_0182926658 /NCGR_PEP_ID=MMETSP0105_2-20130417/12194_1 /TAXON_ID=81532 ORGANISM="Acanthoeca-like sp., Strain 10tr" /NCGR_SAMPLE_ID=MMETSP0105_2 /ASSEMBLY_ACC=CAM_ASM_000205 /LENGTH=566 /DNA_ID=CAMNT_0025064559 /DNA_START=100 /DNA_END=1800 /DNA_ORIENTATION=+